jgi:hypothetical protein
LGKGTEERRGKEGQRKRGEEGRGVREGKGRKGRRGRKEREGKGREEWESTRPLELQPPQKSCGRPWFRLMAPREVGYRVTLQLDYYTIIVETFQLLCASQSENYII